VPLFTYGGLGLVILVLVRILRIWSCLHHWYRQQNSETTPVGGCGSTDHKHKTSPSIQHLPPTQWQKYFAAHSISLSRTRKL